MRDRGYGQFFFGNNLISEPVHIIKPLVTISKYSHRATHVITIAYQAS